MSICYLIYDDGIAVPREVGGIAGVRHFGDLIHRKASLARQIKTAAAMAGIETVEHLRSVADIRQLLGNIAITSPSVRYIYLPANLVIAGGAQTMAHFLGKLRWLRQNVTSTSSFDSNGWIGVAGVDREMLSVILDQRLNGSLAHFMGDHRRNFEELGDGDKIYDLATKPALLEFLSSNFEVRYFNAIEFDTHIVRKSSTDKEKLKREYTYWQLLPEQMKYWFVQPFDFRDEGDRASYSMERLHIPDVAVQWIHGAMGDEAFSRFLDRAFHFLEQRPKRAAAAADCQRLRRELYQEKLVSRFAQLRQHPLAAQVQRLLHANPAVPTDAFDDLMSRYTALLARFETRRKEASLVIGHGDFCFSNILYDQSSGVMRFIDPRGADNEEALWTDPYYDVAKISHSIMGGYDFINLGLFDVVVERGLTTVLQLNVQRPIKEKQDAFLSQLSAHGFDIPLVRLYEASLFLSMAPLHMDIPNKALAFLLNAQNIMTELEQHK